MPQQKVKVCRMIDFIMQSLTLFPIIITCHWHGPCCQDTAFTLSILTVEGFFLKIYSLTFHYSLLHRWKQCPARGLTPNEWERNAIFWSLDGADLVSYQYLCNFLAYDFFFLRIRQKVIVLVEGKVKSFNAGSDCEIFPSSIDVTILLSYM